MKCIRMRTTVTVFFFAFASLFFLEDIKLERVANAQKAEKRCGKQVICGLGNPDCIPLATTLPAVDTEETNFGYGFYGNGTACGASHYWYFFVVECGKPLGAGVCQSLAGCGKGSSLNLTAGL